MRDDPEAAIEVIYGEFLLREELGEAPELGEYQRDHPDYAVELAIQLELHRALEGQAGEGSAGDAGGDDTLPLSPDAGPRPSPAAEAPAPEGYEILEVLGQGGMGVVYKARDTRLGRFVALKFLPPEAARDQRSLARFRREARAASALNHPAVCTLHGLGEYRGRPFLVLEWIEGQTLRALAGPHPDLARLLPLVLQVAGRCGRPTPRGSSTATSSPRTSWCGPDGYVKVLDFGLARLLPAPAGSGTAPGEGATDPGTLLGTPHYMSPEQARAEPVDGATDVFSLGIVLYELTTGRHPFQADAPLAMMYAIVNEPPLPPRRLNPEIPAPLEALILHMLEKDPRRRPTAAEVAEVIAELAGLGAGPRARRGGLDRYPTDRRAGPGARGAIGTDSSRPQPAAACYCASPASPGSARPPWSRTSWRSWPPTAGSTAAPAGAVPSAWPAPRPTCRSWRPWIVWCGARPARRRPGRCGCWRRPGTPRSPRRRPAIPPRVRRPRPWPPRKSS